MAVVRKGGRQLLMTPHQLLGATTGWFSLVLPNQLYIGRTEFRVVSRVDGPHAVSGWVVLEITPPVDFDFLDTPEDFTTPVPIGDPVYTIYWSQLDPEIQRSEHPLGRGFIVRSGRVADFHPPFPVEENGLLGEFLHLEGDSPAGSSGAPVLWYPPHSDVPVIVGINAGTLEYKKSEGTIFERKVAEVGLVRRPHELVDQPQ
jgi:hypothetical protein